MDVKRLLEWDFKAHYQSGRQVEVRVSTREGDFAFEDDTNCRTNCKRNYKEDFRQCMNRGAMLICHSRKPVSVVRIERVFQSYGSDVSALDGHCNPDYLARESFERPRAGQYGDILCD